MTASVHVLRPDDKFALARMVLKDGRYDPSTVAAALDVLQHSADPADMATVRWMRNYAPRIADMAQIDTETLAQRAVTQMQFILLAVAAVGLGIGVVIADWAMTNVIAGVL